MKIPASLALTLRTARQESGLRSSVVAAAARLLPQRLSDYEFGHRNPTDVHLRALCTILRLDFDDLVLRTSWTAGHKGRRPANPAEELALEAFAPDTVYRPPTQRDFAFRLDSASLTNRAVLRRVEAALEARADLPELQLFLRDYPVDSPLEVVFTLVVAELGARGGLLAPMRLGFQTLPVVEPVSLLPVGHRRRPCLVLRYGHFVMVFIPQVCVIAGVHRPILDSLVGISGEGYNTWAVCEVDGRQHEEEKDRERDRAVGLPVRRLRQEDLWRPTIGREIADWLVTVHAARASDCARRLALPRFVPGEIAG